MLGIPAWAIGVGLILVIISLTQVVGRLVAPESVARSTMRSAWARRKRNQ